MAKSIRSKRMRKLRAFKRIRYGEKELARLKKMLEKAAEDEKSMSETSPIGVNADTAAQTLMDVDLTKKNEEVTKPTNKYPSWLSHFKIRKLAKQDKKRKRKEAKRLKKEKKATLKKGKGKKK